MEHNLKISHSPEIKDLVGSLAKAQGVMKPAVFNRVNPHFKTRYADFTSCMDACRSPLSENGIAPIQYCENIDGKLNLVTMLAHTSGQWMKSEFPLIPSKMDSQGIGSAMTYAKRYSLCGMVGIVADEEGDDDGEASVGRGKTAVVNRPTIANKAAVSKISSDQANELQMILDDCDPKYKTLVFDYIYNQYKTKNLHDLSSDIYLRMKEAAGKNMEIYRSNQINEPRELLMQEIK